MSPLRILQLWPQFALTRSQFTPSQEHNNQRDINEMEFEPRGLVFQLLAFFFPFPPFLCTKDALISSMAFLLLCNLPQTRVPYTCPRCGVPEFLSPSKSDPEDSAGASPPLLPPRSSLRTFAETDTSPQQMSSMLIHSSIHSNSYIKFGFGPGTMLDQVRYRDEVDTGLVHRA